ncbi:RNA polymerase sigma factor [uncultured Planktomarina sp.]|uniref:RNA polymerase sigma factor n=1 Tax=uncultured Planktomarina sp. TaxID=1538529 RepID=UPI003261CF64
MALDASQNLEDAELLARFAQGDRAAAQVLTARLAPVVFAQAFRMLGDRAEAEDITQDSLLRLWHAAPDWQAGQAKVTTWLYRVTSNLCIDKMRKRKRQSSDAVPEMPDDGPDMERRLQDRARAQALRAALGGLPERQKQAMTLRHLEGLSNPDVAQIMQISVEAVESLMSRGKRSLADALAPQKKALGLEDDG